MMADLAAAPEAEEQLQLLELDSLLDLLWRRHQFDFRGYSRGSILRRMVRAQQYFGCESLSMLQHRMLHEPAILPDLLSFLTIHVSEMFRDPAYFRALREQVLPHLATFPSLKVWIAGCSTGEELYSLAILFRVNPAFEHKCLTWLVHVKAAAGGGSGASGKLLQRDASKGAGSRLSSVEMVGASLKGRGADEPTPSTGPRASMLAVALGGAVAAATSALEAHEVLELLPDGTVK